MTVSEGIIGVDEINMTPLDKFVTFWAVSQAGTMLLCVCQCVCVGCKRDKIGVR